MNTEKLLTAVLIILIISVASTAAVLFLFPYEPLSPPKADDSGSTQQGISEVVAANNMFAFDLYSQLDKEEDGNIFYSPYSISSALAMTYEGAEVQTADEMKSVFHFPEDIILRPNFAAIYNDINSGIRDYELRTGNALWVQHDYPLLEAYKNMTERYYGGKAANLDFVEETEESRQIINSFIEEQTNYKIRNLIPPGSIDPLTRLVLTNAIYFKGTWEWQFEQSSTREQDFKVTPENVVKVPMMYMDNDKAKFNYADLSDLQILELPYKGGDVSMLILLPKQGEEYDYETGETIEYSYTLEDIELSYEKLEEYKTQMEETKMDAIYLPKFEFDTKYFMKETLSAMGMPTAFSAGSADFSGMDGTRDLYISSVIHQAFVKVDEQGTEAAAATAVIIAFSAAMPTNVFRADHPFIFIIQQKDTGNILFLGKVVDPTE